MSVSVYFFKFSLTAAGSIIKIFIEKSYEILLFKQILHMTDKVS